MANIHNNFKILIVDDNSELIGILRDFLKNEGDVIDGAVDGNDALGKFNSEPYDLVITDLNMPGMTGIELIKEIKKQNDIAEFIIITGYASLDTALEAIKIGAFDYIVKPFKMEELQIVVKNVKEKIKLKRVNALLLEKLNGFYQEIGRYSGPQDSSQSESISATEQLVEEVNRIKRLERNRFFIDLSRTNDH